MLRIEDTDQERYVEGAVEIICRRRDLYTMRDRTRTADTVLMYRASV